MVRYKSAVFSIIFGSIFLFIIKGCAKNDDDQGPLYSNRLENADPGKLFGLWSIYMGELDGESVTVPENDPQCGRDFFSFEPNGSFIEYLIVDNYECTPETNHLQWTMDKGVITLNIGNESEKLVVVELTDQKFVFRAEGEYDEDGKSEIFTFTARRYNPPADLDVYSTTFNRDVVFPHYDKIRLSWRAYQGFNTFEKYEIYRSKDGCGKANADLITTIFERDTDFFIDPHPNVGNPLCYYFKLYTDKGLLSESDLISVDPSNLEVSTVTLEQPTVTDQTINLNWSKYEGYYFSHYELTVRNYEDGYGSSYQRKVIATIDDINNLSYEDTDPPYLLNPVYAVSVVDIFGNRSNGLVQGINSWTVNFKRIGLLEMDYIRQVSPDFETTVIYIYGKHSDEQDPNLLKFNYITNTIEAYSDQPPNTSSEGNMKLINSASGKELILPVGNELRVYNALNLNFKYRIDVNSSHVSDFEYMGNGIWAVTDSDFIYTFSRSGNAFTQISKKAHFTEHQAYPAYHILPVGNGKIVIGHFNEPTNLTYTIDASGILTNRTIINSVIRSEKENDTYYSSTQDKIVGLLEHNVYSTTDFTLQQTFIDPYNASGISTDGSLILGTPNDKLWPIDDTSSHEKKALLFNLSTMSLQEVPTKGYPHLIFQNYLGQFISISTGFKRAKLDDYNFRPDFFVEQIRQ